VSVGCYIAAFTFSGILFIWFNPSGHDCGLNVFFIVMTMILAFAFGIIALHPTVSIIFIFLLGVALPFSQMEDDTSSYGFMPLMQLSSTSPLCHQALVASYILHEFSKSDVCPIACEGINYYLRVKIIAPWATIFLCDL
jgi:hypothetical protein